jgi:hypothetical protein
MVSVVFFGPYKLYCTKSQPRFRCLLRKPHTSRSVWMCPILRWGIKSPRVGKRFPGRRPKVAEGMVPLDFQRKPSTRENHPLHLHRIWMTSWMVLLISTLWQFTETQFWMSIKHSVIDILGTHSVVEVAVVYFWDFARNIVQQIVHAFNNSQWPHVFRVRSFCRWDKGIAQNLFGWINIHKSAILGYHEGITILTRGHIPIPVDFAPDSGSSTLK